LEAVSARRRHYFVWDWDGSSFRIFSSKKAAMAERRRLMRQFPEAEFPVSVMSDGDNGPHGELLVGDFG
jgi:hypothetical protein